MTTLLIAGATGLVGRHVVDDALKDARVTRVVALTRRALPAHPKLENPVVDFDALPADAPWWEVDAVVCALGTTLRDAGSRKAFRRVDFDYVHAIALHARARVRGALHWCRHWARMRARAGSTCAPRARRKRRSRRAGIRR